MVILQLLEDENSADDEFWNQEFFEEEAADIEYNSSNASEAESVDVPDTDFDESVSDHAWKSLCWGSCRALARWREGSDRRSSCCLAQEEEDSGGEAEEDKKRPRCASDLLLACAISIHTS